MNPYNLHEKALAILHVCSLPVDGAAFYAYQQRVFERFSKKAVDRKLGELIERGYIEARWTPSGGQIQLTEKGKRALGGTV